MITDLVSWFELQLQTNDFFAGLFAVSAMGYVLFAARGVPGLLWKVFLSQYTVKLEVLNTDEAFDWIIQWLGEQDYARKTRRLKVSSVHSNRPRGENDQSDFVLSPGLGNHFFRYNRRFVWLNRFEPEEKGGNQTGKPRERVEFRILGRDQELVREIIQEAKMFAEKEEYIKVYSWNSSYWNMAALRLPREQSSLILEQGQCECLIADAEEFLRSAHWYAERGLPWRRGYLLSGPPGTGKSSFALVMASHFHRPIYSLNLNSVGDSTLLESLSEVPRNAILLIEDVDAAQASSDRKKKEKKEDVLTTSGLLNALDGVAATEGRVLIMTTNYPEKLDEALIRPGRVDLHEDFKLCNRDMIIRMFLVFYPNKLRQASDFSDKFVGVTDLSPATLQGIFIKHRTIMDVMKYDPNL